jgi:hypothetical protein
MEILALSGLSSGFGRACKSRDHRPRASCRSLFGTIRPRATRAVRASVPEWDFEGRLATRYRAGQLGGGAAEPASAARVSRV